MCEHPHNQMAVAQLVPSLVTQVGSDLPALDTVLEIFKNNRFMLENMDGEMMESLARP